MKKHAPARPAASKSTPPDVQAVRDAADALYRAAVECCHQHDRVSRIVGKSDLEEELVEAQKVCETCNASLGKLTRHYEAASASVHPSGTDEQWWRCANALWLASKEYLRRHRGCDAASRQLKSHGREDLGALHTEYELEASSLLALRHAADAYQRGRPIAA
jgi:hypothetical protein